MISIRHIERTCLSHDAFVDVIKKYSNLEHDVLVVFDRRLSCAGLHIYDYETKLHTIRISPENNQHSFSSTNPHEPVRLDIESEKYNLISTILHELKHAHQREELKQSFFRHDYRFSKNLRNPYMAEFYSKCELEAREYECKFILDAIKFYDSCCAQT